ncbi:MAG: ABC transporter permease [Blastocatellia bacterium]|nr:ABC transporter permease [Blastocatellia bacterium]
MKFERVLCFVVTICVVSAAGCAPIRSQRKIFNPPENSYKSASFELSYEGESQKVDGAFITQAFFESSGVAPMIGRLFLPEEHGPNSEPVAILSHRCWEERFGSDPMVIGKIIQVDGRLRAIVGIMPKDIDVPPGAEIWLPEL